MQEALKCLFILYQHYRMNQQFAQVSEPLFRIITMISISKNIEKVRCNMLLLSHFSTVWPIDGSPPGSPIPGILQARTLEWVAISFSNTWKWKVKVKSLSHVWLLVTPWTAAHQAPPPMGFSRQEYWSGVPLPSHRNLNLELINSQNFRPGGLWGCYSLCLKNVRRWLSVPFLAKLVIP